MARAIRKWHTPDSYEADSICRPLALPHWSLLAYVGGALSELTKPYNWEQVGSMTPAETAEVFSQVLQEWEGECGMNCAELLACLDSVQTRINPETGEYERSTDGGETWTAAPELDPRISSAPYAPMNDDGCEAANAITGMLQRWVDEQADVLAISSTIFAVAGVLASLAALIFTGGLAMPLLITAAGIAVTQGAAAIAAAMTAGVYEDFRCIVMCAIGDATTITQEIFDSITDEVDAEFTLTAHAMISAYLVAMGPVGLQNAVALGLPAGGIAEDCDECDCLGLWEHTFDFTTDAHGFVADTNYGGCNAPRTATGWETCVGGGNWNAYAYREIAADPDTHFTRLRGTMKACNASAVNTGEGSKFSLDVVGGADYNLPVNLNGSSSPMNFDSGDIDIVNVQQVYGKLTLTSASCGYIQAITVNGYGPDPFL